MSDEEEVVELPGNFGTGTVVERIDTRDLTPLFNPNHPHMFTKDPTDETDDFYAEVCAVDGCGIGRLIAKR